MTSPEQPADAPPEAFAPFGDFSDLDAGATFFRADLHMHSYGISPDVRDEQMTVERIVAASLDREIDLIAITDHNAIGSVRPLIDRAATEGLAVVCGVEISATEGHLLVYFDPDAYDAFEVWFQSIRFEKDDATGDRSTLTPMHELIGSATAEGGVAIPAHVGRQGSGFAVKALTKSQDAIIKSAGVLALEVDGPDEFDWFSASDNATGSSERKRQLKLRNLHLGLLSEQSIPKVRFSDAHRLEAIGKNRDGRERLTRFKMAAPGFEGFRTALLDADARVKLEDVLPAQYPRIVGARFEGGFLDGQEIRFSNNLTCLIGGRGTGKSTALGSVRSACLADLDAEAEGANRPSKLQLLYVDSFGERHFLERRSGEPTVELTPDGSVQSVLEIEGYAQNRVTEITTSYPHDPKPLLEFLDGFADLRQIDAELADSVTQLVVNAEQLLPLEDAEARLRENEQKLKDIELRLGAIEKSRFKAAYEWKLKLEKERVLRGTINRRLSEIRQTIDGLALEISVQAIAEESAIGPLDQLPSHDQIVGAPGQPGVVAGIDGLAAALEQWQKDAQQIFISREPALLDAMARWEERDKKVEERYQQVVQELREQGIAPDIKAIDQLLAAQGEAKSKIAKAKEDIALLGSLRTQREALLASRRQALVTRFHLRQQALAGITSQLNGSIDEFRVKISHDQGALVEEYEGWLRAALANRFFRAERLTYFCATVHPIDLAKFVREANYAQLRRLKDEEGVAYFRTKDDAEAFVVQVGGSDLRHLETLDVNDRPRITLTTDLDGTPTTVQFENLSLGQKASVLLGALLFADDPRPLIIDQPEDHLDSRFIFGTVVSNLRQVKEKRQVIVATHNANIAILGDAEMIVPLQGWKGKGVVREPGSVDARETRSRACDILEGGTSAYTKRGEMYGLLDPAVRRPASRG